MTTLVVDDQLIAEAQVLSDHKTASEIVMDALKEYIRYRKQLHIISLFGTIDYDGSFDYKKQRHQA